MRLHYIYTEKEIKYFLENFHKMKYQEFAIKFDRNLTSIKHLAASLGVNKLRNKNSLSQKEIEKKLKKKFFKSLTKKEKYIIKYNNIKTYKEIGKYLNINEGAVRYIARKKLKLPLKKIAKQDSKTIQYVKDNYFKMGISEIAKNLNKTETAIQLIANRNGLRKREFWTKAEIEYICDNYTTMSLEKMEKILNKSIRAIEHKLYDSGIRRAQQSSIELKTKEILFEENINFLEQVNCGKYRIDFVVGTLAIEVNGDFWHCNPDVYKKPLYEMQVKHAKRDKIKLKYLKSVGYKILIIWETEFKNIDQVKTKILAAVKQANIGETPKQDNTEITELITKGNSAS